MTATARTTLRRGACPGLSAPMQTGDGLLARLMPAGTIMLDAMADLGAAARRHGNGIIEITARGSVQIRGLTPDSAPAFADAVAALDIPAHEGVPIATDPLAGLDPGELIDAGELAAALRGALAATPLAKQLGAKVSVAIDGGGALHLDALTADIRLRAAGAPDRPQLHVALGGDAASATPLGTIAVVDAVDTVIRLLRAIAARGSQARGRDLADHMPDHMADRKPTEVHPSPSRRAADPIGLHRLRDGATALGVGFAFGHTDAEMLTCLVDAATHAGAVGVRTAPGRALLIIGAATERMAGLLDAAAKLDFIVAPGDLRRRVVACAGAPTCAAGEIAARALAPEVAQAAARLVRGDDLIHVSGCVKGCAHRGAAALTAVGRAGACDLFVDGAPAGTVAAGSLSGRLAELAAARSGGQ